MSFTHTSKISPAHYIKFLYGQYYKKPAIILIHLIALYFLSRIIQGTASIPSFEFYYVIFSIVFPNLMIFLNLKKPGVKKYVYAPMQYTFSDETILIQGVDFKTELKWSAIRKVTVMKHLLFLKTSRTNGTLFDKSLLTPEEMEFIRERVQNTISQ
ncbi:YcxB family protein [Chitinophaga sancti]|uniref:YcxB family protein n=1 Tax=Chitinophaga sancti TaxID=1004 RepID=A0A1K1S1R4_9BACT|nr:YcxB family protein [Chitinophaga sancti]WQD59725.1 YcxB family protein [Chitinophaga sancti]WQG88144.1 YcxB family protein [Chitinophaga sancti]SFW78098.1 YcxB-like protein [Chitinophaga sancti]